MSRFGLTDREMDLILGVLKRHAEITGAVMFGSRAKGIASLASDIDLALEGVEDELAAEAIAAELEDLPLPYRFDVKAMVAIHSQALPEHIDRVGVKIHG